jgi:hypothetical protein
MVKLVSKHFPKLAHRITLLLFAIWRQKWDFSNKTKACDHLICRLLTVFNIEFGGERGNNFRCFVPCKSVPYIYLIVKVTE